MPAETPKPAGYFDVVFDGPPSHESGRFVEVEDEHGRSFDAGEWIQDGDLWRLRIARALPAAEPEIERTAPLSERYAYANALASDVLGDVRLYASSEQALVRLQNALASAYDAGVRRSALSR